MPRTSGNHRLDVDNYKDASDRIWIKRIMVFGGLGMEKTLEFESCELPYTGRGLRRLDYC